MAAEEAVGEGGVGNLEDVAFTCCLCNHPCALHLFLLLLALTRLW